MICQPTPLISGFRALRLLALAAILPATALAQGYTFTTFAGTAGVTGSTDATGTAARLNKPSGIAVDNQGNFYVADRINRIIRKMTPAGVVTTLAGTAGVMGDADGTGTAAQFRLPTALAVDSSGNVFVADQGAQVIRKITPAGAVTTFAGTAGTAGSEDGTGTAATFRTPSAIAVDSSGNVYVGDSQNHVIRKITPAGVVTTLVGVMQTRGSTDGTGAGALLNYPSGLAIDGSGNIIVSDGSNNLIRKVTPAGVVTTIAGTALQSGSTDAVGANARFNFPAGIAVDSGGNIIVADEGNSTIRKISPAGAVTTIGGSPGVLGSTDGTGSSALFRYVNGIAVDGSDAVFAADEGNSTIRKGVPPTPPSPRIMAMSQRAASLGADAALVASFAVEGMGTKKVLIRAVGPTLGAAPFNVSGALADPFLTLYSSTGAPITNNNDWGGTTELSDAFAAAGAIPFATNSKDSALLVTLDPGVYTARITGVGGTTGIAMIEVYDTADAQRLVYSSNRGSVAAGATNTTSFVLGGAGTAGSKRVLIRAVGAGLGLPGALANPTITVKTSGGTTLASNDNWGSSNVTASELAAATTSAGAMPLANADAALLLTLPGGVYSVDTTGADGGGGIVLTEVHLIDDDRFMAFGPALLAPLHPPNLPLGGGVTFTAAFLAKPAPTFQWQKAGVDITGATNLTLTLSSVTAADAGEYRVKLANTFATTTSAAAAVTVNKAAQTITFGEIASRKFVYEGTFTLGATASSGLPVAYSSSNTAVATVSGSTVTIFDVGTTTITASQAGNDNYLPAAIVEQTLTITKADGTVTLGGLSHTYDGSAKSATATTAPNPGMNVTFTYNGSATAPTNAGSYAVVATIDSLHYQGSATGTMVIQKAGQTITFDALAAKVYGDAAFTVTASASSSLPVTLSSSNTSVATVSGNTITIVGAGTATITASQAGNSNISPASVERTLTVAKAGAPVTLGSLSHTYNGSVKGATATTNPSGLNVSFTYEGTASATTAPTDAGSYAVTGTIVDSNYAGSASGTVVIAKAPQTISFAALASRPFNDPNFTLEGTASSGLAISYTSSNPAVAEIVSGNAVDLKTPGTTTITAAQAGNSNYLAADSVAQTLIVSNAGQVITFDAIAARTYAPGDTFTLTAVSRATSDNALTGLTVSFASSNPNVATISGNTVTVAGAGTTTITASQAGNDNFAAAANVTRTLTINKAAASVALGGLSATYDGSSKPASATTTPSGLSVTFMYTAPGGTASSTAPTNVGSYAVTGTVDDANYSGSATGTLVIAKANQTITFSLASPVLINAAAITLDGSASSGLAVSYSSSNALVASVSGSTLMIRGLGTATITATQPGDANYNAAANVTRTVTVNPVAPVITSTPPTTVTAIKGSRFVFGPIGLNALSAPVTFSMSGHPAGLSVDPASGNISGIPSLTANSGDYPITLTATNATGSNAKTITLTLQPPAPAFTSAASATGTVGSAFTYTAAASNATSYTMTGTLPSGVTFADGIISGTPTESGTFTVNLTATNATGSVTLPLSLTFALPADAPVYAGTRNPSGTAGTAFTFTPNFGAGTGTTTYALSGSLPTGISFAAATGALSGTPTQIGEFPVTLSATRSGVTVSVDLTVTINPAATAPVIGFPAPGNVRSATVGTAFGPLTLTATPAATSFSATGLPAGLSMTASGVISGTPTTQGTTIVLLTATNSAGTGPTATLEIVVHPHANAPVLTSAAVVPGRVGTALSYSLSATPTGATTYAIVGALPSGLTFDGNAGTVTGTPGAGTHGDHNVFFTGTNASGTGPALPVTFAIAPPLTVPAVTSNGSAHAQVGQPFSYLITATNSPTSFGAANLPAGLSLAPGTGVISGVPAAATPIHAPAIVTLTATNADGTSSPKTLLVTITPAPSTPVITSAGTASGRVGTAFAYQITASESPTSFSASNLPPGLALNPTTGAISGTPTQAGPFIVTLRAANAAGLGGESTLGILVAPATTAPAITSAAVATGQVGVAFTYQIVAAPGPITSYALRGSLPAGLTLNTATGAITGSATMPGSYAVTLTATSAAGTSQPQTLSILVSPAAGAPVITSAGIASAMAGSNFSYTITATNPPHTSLDAVNLPAGVAVNPYTGVIQGVPSTIGTTTASVVGTNAAGTGPTRELVINVRAALTAPVITSAALASAQVGTNFAYAITATQNPTSFEVLSAPGWMTIDNTTGAIAGTPTAPGTVQVQLLATNASGTSNPLTLVIQVAAAAGTPVITSTRTATGRVGIAFSHQLTASPAATSFLATGLPAGLALNMSSGAISGTPTVSGEHRVIVSARNASGIGQPITLMLSISPNATLVVPGP